MKGTLLGLLAAIAFFGAMIWIWRRDLIGAVEWIDGDHWALFGIVIPGVVIAAATAGIVALIKTWAASLERNEEELGKTRVQLLSAVIAMAAALILLVVTFRLAPAPPARESIWGFPMLGFWFAFVGGTASLLVYRTLRRSVIASILRRNPRTPGIRRFRAMAAQSATSSVFDPITGEPIVGWQVEANTVNYRQSTTTELVKEWTYDPEYGRRQELVPKEVPTTVKEKGIAYRQGQISPFVAVLPDGTPLYVEGDFVVNGKPSGGRHRVSHGGGTAQLQDILRSINAVRFRILTIRFGALVVVTGMVHDEGGHLVVTPIGAPLEAPSTHDDHPDVVSFVRAL